MTVVDTGGWATGHAVSKSLASSTVAVVGDWKATELVARLYQSAFDMNNVCYCQLNASTYLSNLAGHVELKSSGTTATKLGRKR